ncbi:MAG: FAD-dependent oxidoreductase [Gammaproteobacteria bacterium]|nr:FAD-dependent oxidoreductase [Gammaproteobacteria bacterium]
MSEAVDVVVAGGGVAGLTAAWHLARLGRGVTVLTGGVPGGHLLSLERIDGLPGFPEGIAGYDFGPILQEQAETAGAVCSGAELTGFARAGSLLRVHTTEGDLAARALVIATGTKLRRLDVPGEEALRGRGVSECASCDAPLLRGRSVAVVGGGDSALQEALTLADAGVAVTVLQRAPELSAKRDYQQRLAAHANITVRCNIAVEEILGDDAVTGLALRDIATGATERIEGAAVFVVIGLRPASAVVATSLACDGADAIITDAALMTSQPGVYAVGTVRAGSAGQAVHAAGDGANVAISIDRHLSGGVA